MPAQNPNASAFRPTPPTSIASKPHRIGTIPETLGVLVGAMDIRRQFITQTQYVTDEEYWRCQRDLAGLERRWAEAERVWAAHIAKEGRT